MQTSHEHHPSDADRIGEPAASGRASLSGSSRTCTYLLTPQHTEITTTSNAPNGTLLQYNIVSGDGISTMRIDAVPLQGIVLNSLGNYVVDRYNFRTAVPGIAFTMGFSTSSSGPFTLLSPGLVAQAGNVGATFVSQQWTSVRLMKTGVVARGTYYIPQGQMAVYAYGSGRTPHVQWIASQPVKITVT